MARLADRTFQYLENLLATNPTTALFTSLFFTDIPANSGLTSGQAYGNPTRTQVLNAFTALADQAKNWGGVVNPLTYPDPSTASLTGQMNSNLGPNANGASDANSGLPNQTPTNSTSPAGTANIDKPVAIAQAVVQLGVLVAPPAYVPLIQHVAQVE